MVNICDTVTYTISALFIIIFNTANVIIMAVYLNNIGITDSNQILVFSCILGIATICFGIYNIIYAQMRHKNKLIFNDRITQID